jgi:hypothetical protein
VPCYPQSHDEFSLHVESGMVRTDSNTHQQPLWVLIYSTACEILGVLWLLEP